MTFTNHGERITDGVSARPGAPWASALTSVISAGGGVEWDLGRIEPLARVWLEADNNDGYALSASTDRRHWTTVWEAPPVDAVGLQVRSSESLAGEARYLRLEPRGGDASYSVAELVVARRERVAPALAGTRVSLNEALKHAGIHTHSKINIHYLDSEELEKSGLPALDKMDAILVPGGFGKRGTEGKMRAIRYARENGVPYLGICLGMQLATIEFARNVCGLAGANSTEFDRESPHPVVALITEWLDRTGQIEQRSEQSDLGGTMRLGAQKCPVDADTKAFSIYGKEVNERHRHRYEVNNVYVPQLEAKGYRVSAHTPSENLPEMMELPAHPFFVGVQFHPEFTSTPRTGHPLFTAFVAAALRYRATVKRPGGTLSVVAA